MSASPSKVQEREQRLKEALLFLSALYLNLLMDLEEYEEIAHYMIITSWADTVEQVNEELTAQGFTPISPDELEPILEQSLADFKDETAELFDEPLEAQSRMEKTSWFVNWKTHGEGTRRGLKAAGADLIMWNTQNDEKVCPICGPRHLQTYTPEAAPELPAHISCRCFWSIPVERTDEADARERLDSMFDRYMKQIGYRK